MSETLGGDDELARLGALEHEAEQARRPQGNTMAEGERQAAESRINSRRCRIGWVIPQTFEALLSGEAKCINWPPGTWVRRIMFDGARDAWLLQLVNPEFSEVAEKSVYPDFDLLFQKL